jgi:hypothetical protein
MICSDWITPTDLVDCDCPSDAPAGVVADSISTASEILYRLTGMQFPGECTETLRPCSNSGAPAGFDWGLWTFPWVPLRIGGSWINVGPCGCNMAACDCSTYPRLNLGRSDVTSITEVLIDGAALDPSAYRLDEGRYLTRIDGAGWPCCQHLDRDTTETGTWSVELAYGWPVPEALKRAAASLAAELVKACTGGECRLPPRTQSVVKQGVTISISGVMDELQAGLTGLTDVDLAVAAFNPHRLTRPAFAWSPGLSQRGLRAT